MKIDVYCPICKTTSRIDFDPKKSDAKPNDQGFLPIPSPDSVGGLRKLSIVHDDHILILDVDENGSVRRTDTINRITSNVQRYVATASSMLKRIGIKDRYHIKIVSDSESWKKFLNYVSGQLIVDTAANLEKITYFSNTSGAELNYQGIIVSLQSPSIADSTRTIHILIIDDKVLDNKNLLDSLLVKTAKREGVIVINLTDEPDKDATTARLTKIMRTEDKDILFKKISSVEEAALAFNQVIAEVMNP